MLKRKSLQSKWKSVKRLDSLDLRCRNTGPITMPPKKDEFGNWTIKRPCCDYRMLNKVLVTDRYVLPTPEDIFDNIKDAGVYTTLDLRWGFHQVRVAEEDIPKTAFWGLDGSKVLYR
jgi:hypothetical protein